MGAKMRRVRILALGALTTILILIVGLVAPQKANATTSYDNITVSGGSFTISYHGQPWTSVACTQNVLDLTTRWRDLILDESKWDIGGGASTADPTDAIEDFEDALTRGNGWGVTQVYNTDAGLNSFGSSLMAYGGEQDTWLQVWWNDTGTASFEHTSPYGPVLTADGNVHVAIIYFSGASGHQCEPRVTQHALDNTAPSVLTTLALDNDAYTYYHCAPVFLNFDIDRVPK